MLVVCSCMRLLGKEKVDLVPTVYKDKREIVSPLFSFTAIPPMKQE